MTRSVRVEVEATRERKKDITKNEGDSLHLLLYLRKKSCNHPSRILEVTLGNRIKSRLRQLINSNHLGLEMP